MSFTVYPQFSRLSSILVFLTLLLSPFLAGQAAAATLSVCRTGCAFSDPQEAIDAAQLGDTVLLRAGETFVGNFVLRRKAGTSGPSILIRSDAPDSAFPSASTRLIPIGYAGGNTQQSALPRLIGPGGLWKTTPVIAAEQGAHHYRLQFLDIDGISQIGWETLVELGTNGPEQTTLASVPHDITLDRVFVHGHPVKLQKRCIALNGRNLEVLNSYVAACGSFSLDAQAISIFNAPGPLRIINNYLEATTENIMAGGADPSIPNLVPSDIEIRRNHVFKPVAWRNPVLSPPAAAPSASLSPNAGVLQPGTLYFKIVAVLEVQTDSALSAPSPERAFSITSGNAAVVLQWPAVSGAERYRVYVGSSPGGQNRYVETADANTTYIYRGGGEVWAAPPTQGRLWNVKNLLELKNAQRVVIDGNVFEHIWSASQVGYAIVLTPRNQDGSAPQSAVRDIDFTNNILKHAAGGINILGNDDVQVAQPLERVKIRNNLVYDLSWAWGGASNFLLMTRSPVDIEVDHNTILHDGNVVLIDDGASPGFDFTNNLTLHNSYGIFGSGAGIGNAAIAAYFPGAVVRRNVLAGGNASLYPVDNLFPDVATFMAQFQNAAATDFRLIASSSFRGAGTDGKDIGVDFAALAAALPAGAIAGTTPGDGGTGGSTTPPPTPPAPSVTLPGTIQAESFDEGGAGVAYSDTTAGNAGGEFRATDVDVEATTDANGGYNVGWAFAGEWLRYTVTVTSAATYDIQFRVAALGQGGTFHLEVDGVDKTGPLTIPDTGDWQSWVTVRRNGVALGAGAQIWRLVFDTNGASGAVGNLNEIRVTAAATGGGGSTPYGGTPRTLPGTLQAEDFDSGGPGIAFRDLSSGNEGGSYRSEAVDVETTTDSGGGFNVGWMFAGEWTNYTVNVTEAGTFDVEARVASAGRGGTFHIEINGVDRTGPLTVPDTGGWQTWRTIRRTGVALSAGPQVWRLVMDTNGATTAVGNINYLRVARVSATVGTGDIVLYSSDVTTVRGNWARLSSTTGAGGSKMQSADYGWSAAAQPLASPADYFEAQFVPEANRAYRVWLRLRAGGDSKWNDSVWVQFTGAVDANGAALWRPGSASGLLVNLEACAGCGVESWGWQSAAWWVDSGGIVRFPTATAQTIRVQTREDGVDVDQIVLSPITYFDRAPGGVIRDGTIVPK